MFKLYSNTIRSLICLTALGVVSSSAQALPTELLNDGSFESTISPQGSQTSWTSSAYGSWAVGDPMSTSSGENGISPLDGSKMLRFGNSGGSSSDLYQLIDVSSYASQIDAGLATVNMSVYFNSTSVNSGMGLRLGGYTSSAPTSFSGFTVLGGAYNNLTSDGDINTWELFTVDDILLTSGTRFLAFGIHEPTSGPQGYADKASLLLTIASVPEPSVLALLAGGLLGVGFARKLKSV